MPINGFSKTAVREYAKANGMKYTAALRVFETRRGAGDDLSLLTFLTEHSRDATPFGDFARDFIADPDYSGDATGGDMASWLEEGIGDNTYEGVDIEARWEEFERWRISRGGLRAFLRDCNFRYTEHDDASLASLTADPQLSVFHASFRGLSEAIPTIETKHPDSLDWALSALGTHQRLEWDHEHGLDSPIIDNDPTLPGYRNHDPHYGYVRWTGTLPSFTEDPALTFSTGYAVYCGAITPGKEYDHSLKRTWEFHTEKPEGVESARVFAAALSDGKLWRKRAGTFSRLDLYVRYPEGAGSK